MLCNGTENKCFLSADIKTPKKITKSTEANFSSTYSMLCRQSFWGGQELISSKFSYSRYDSDNKTLKKNPYTESGSTKYKTTVDGLEEKFPDWKSTNLKIVSHTASCTNTDQYVMKGTY
jgi:hypothetical protein